MYKIGDVLMLSGRYAQQQNKTYIITDTDCKKTGSYYTTYELYCVQTQEYIYRVVRTIEHEYRKVQSRPLYILPAFSYNVFST